VNKPWIGVAVGFTLIGIGFSLASSHVRSWRLQQADPELEEEDRKYYERRYRRQMQIARLLEVIGVLIEVGVALFSLPQLNQTPWIATIYLLVLLLLTGWLMLLGFAEFGSRAAHIKAQFARAHRKEDELKRQLVEFKHRNAGGRRSDLPNGEH
jgi:cation transport ATPase